MSAIGNFLKTGLSSLFGPTTAAAAGGAASAPALAAPIQPTSTAPTSLGSTMDPTTQAILAMMQQDQGGNLGLATAAGLGTVGNELLLAKLRPELGEMAPQARPATTGAPGPLPFVGGQEPASPIATAALIAQLL